MNPTRRKLFKMAGLVTLGGLAATIFPTRRSLAHEDHGAAADLVIRAGEFYFKAGDNGEGEPFELEAGEPHLIHFINEGVVDHEVHFGREPDLELRSYRQNLFGPDGEHAPHGFMGLHLKPGESGTLHIWVPPEKRGEWELGCFIPGHFEAGQRAPFSVV